MIVGRPYSPLELTAEGFAPGATVGVALYAADGTLYRARTTAGVVESPAASGLFTATIVAPAERGAYVAVWDNGAGVGAAEAFLVRPAGRPADLEVGETFVAVVVGMPPGLVGTIGVRVEDGQGGLVTARTTAGVVEIAPLVVSGIYARALVAPAPAGTFTVVWDEPAGPTIAAEQVQVEAAPLPHELRLEPAELDEVRVAGGQAWLDETCEVRRRPEGGQWAAVATDVPCAITLVASGGIDLLGGGQASGGEPGSDARLDVPVGTVVRAGDVVLTDLHRLEVSRIEPPGADAILLSAYGRLEEL